MIRPMQADDREKILSIIRKTNMFTEAEFNVAVELIDIYLNCNGQHDYRIVVIVNNQEEPVGYLTWGPTPLAEDVYDIYWMAIAPQEQGKGLGRKLVNWLENEILKVNGRMIVIETSSQLKYMKTREFYQKLGYKEVARVPDFYRPGDDRIIYAKNFR